MLKSPTLMLSLLTLGFALEADILGCDIFPCVFWKDLDKSQTEHKNPVQIKLVVVRSSIKATMFWSILVTKAKLLDPGNAKQEAKMHTFINGTVSPMNVQFPYTHLVHSAQSSYKLSHVWHWS